MRYRRLSELALVAGILTSSISTWATSGILHTFQQRASGFEPSAPLVADSQGNLWGTTLAGGDDTSACQIGVAGCGTLFKLTPNGRGGFIYSLIYKFQGWPLDGSEPLGGLILDSAGNLYGTTTHGGAFGSGTVFRLSPTAGGGWTEGVLYSFTGSADGSVPVGKLALDAAGNLYGATQAGGPLQYGTIFELSPTSGGGWTESVLHSFYSLPMGADGYYPTGGLLLDASGNLYGAAYGGGAEGDGLIFELSKTSGGGWAENILYNFTGGSDGYGPENLMFDTSGNIYGACEFAGGAGYQGTVFKLSPSQGAWAEQTLYAFNYNGGDGGRPTGVVMDSAGNLYGATVQGGKDGWGILYELNLKGDGTWRERVLHTFTGGADGAEPSPLILGADGNLYGAASYGGVAYGYDGFGTAFGTAP